MEYYIEVRIADDVEAADRKIIADNLNEGTMILTVFPRAKMPILLTDEIEIFVDSVKPKRKFPNKPDALIIVRPLKILA